jgi:hypothetical protein
MGGMLISHVMDTPVVTLDVAPRIISCLYFLVLVEILPLMGFASNGIFQVTVNHG